MRRLEPIVLQIEIVYDLGNARDGRFGDAESTLKHLEGAVLAFMLESGRLVHVKGHGVGIFLGSRGEHEDGGRIDEPADEPRRREPVHTRPRTGHPLPMCEIARFEVRLEHPAGRVHGRLVAGQPVDDTALVDPAERRRLEDARLAAQGDHFGTQPLEIFARLLARRKHVDRVFHRNRSYLLQPPPDLHAPVGRMRRQLVHEDKPALFPSRGRRPWGARRLRRAEPCCPTNTSPFGLNQRHQRREYHVALSPRGVAAGHRAPFTTNSPDHM